MSEDVPIDSGKTAKKHRRGSSSKTIQSEKRDPGKSTEKKASADIVDPEENGDNPINSNINQTEHKVAQRTSMDRTTVNKVNADKSKKVKFDLNENSTDVDVEKSRKDSNRPRNSFMKFCTKNRSRTKQQTKRDRNKNTRKKPRPDGSNRTRKNVRTSDAETKSSEDTPKKKPCFATTIFTVLVDVDSEKQDSTEDMFVTIDGGKKLDKKSSKGRSFRLSLLGVFIVIAVCM